MSQEPSIAWDDAARLEIEKLSIFARERIQQRVAELVRRQGRRRVTLADLEAARAQGMGRVMAATAATSAAAPEPEHAWPVCFGSYRLGDPNGSVAICTLASAELARSLGVPPGVAVVGHAFTENLGVEKIVLNVVSNPAIRVLVLAGTESRHHVGQTLVALAANGADAGRRVIGSEGPVPVLASLPEAAVRLFQAKVAVVDLIGEQDLGAIQERVATLVAERRQPWPETWQPDLPRLRAEYQARMGRPTDPAGFLLVGIGPYGDRLYVEHYRRDGVLSHIVSGDTAQALCHTVLAERMVSDLTHATYLGRELQKAEVALKLGREYVQDRPLDLPSPA